MRIDTSIPGEAGGARAVLEAFRSGLDKQKVAGVVTEVASLGLSYADPVVDVKTPGGPRVLYANVPPDKVADIISNHLCNGTPVKELAMATIEGSIDGVPSFHDLPIMKDQIRIALRNCGHIDPTDVYQYIANGGFEALDKALTGMTPQEVLQQVKDSGLRGRGGAAFPTGVKWGFLAGSASPVKYILCNSEEGDPGAFNDKGILEGDPFTVLEGMLLAGYATSATNGIVFIRHGHHGPIERTKAAIRACYQVGLLGRDIMGTAFDFDISVSLTGESYVAGEETALMESIEGKPARPRYRPPFPAAIGVWGKPSNINNVKTLAYVPEIVRKGAEWFKSIGTEKSTGTAILCLSGNIVGAGMMEVPFGLTLKHILMDLAGGVPGGGRLKLLQTGGPLGGVLSAEKLDTVLDFDAMAQAGAILGSGGIIVGDENVCAVSLTRNLVAFCQLESCGKCFPCRMGMGHILEIVERVSTYQTRSDDIKLLEIVGRNMQSASLCGHGQLGFNPVSSAMDYFKEDFRMHIEDRRCPTGQCDRPFVSPKKTQRRAHFLGESPTSQVYPNFVGVDVPKLTPTGFQRTRKSLKEG